MNPFKQKYICPFCFKHNTISEIAFRCTNSPERCPPEPDHVYSEFRGFKQPRIMNRVIQPAPLVSFWDQLKSLRMPEEIVCTECEEITSKRICPACHSELPYTIGAYKDMIFGVIGAKNAGKSHYISVLLHKIQNEIGMLFDCNLHPLNDDTIKRYRNDFHDPIFRRQEIITGTLSARQDFNVRLPLSYTLSFLKNGLFKKNKISNIATIVFFDTAGEDLNDEDVMSTENRYIYNSSGIILLIDPLQFKDVREGLPQDTNLPDITTDAMDIMERAVNLIRKALSLPQEKKIKIPIAVAFSKMDALTPLLDLSNFMGYTSKHQGKFYLDEFETVNSEMEALISGWEDGLRLVNLLRVNFETYAFFGLTALGCNPHGGSKIPKRPRPKRVEDPFLWLLWKKRMIKAKKHS